MVFMYMYPDTLNNVFFFCGVAASLLLLSRWSKASSTDRRLPGPKPKWLVGNLFDIPTQCAWLVFTEWKQRYDILRLHALGNSIIVLNTFEAITELFETRGTIYSDRPVLTMAGELIGVDQSTSMLQYGSIWKKHRRLNRIALSPEAVKKYIPVQTHIATLYLRALLETPDDFIAQLRLTTGRIILAITYGISVKTADEEYITETEATLKMISRTMIPGKYMVDLIPPLKYIPVGFPLAKFRREAIEGNLRLVRVVTRPLEYVKREMAAGTARPSFASELLNDTVTEGGGIDRETEETLKWAAGTMFAGGETTYATILTLIMAMALFPEKQDKAQADIDRVTRSERLPDARDRPALPYITALIKETMRWHVVLPLSIARRLGRDDCYKGYNMPAGSVLIPNVWAISRDEMTHKHPEEFLPERFLDPQSNSPDPYTYCFGFGRRMCPGRFLADNSLFIIAASILSAFRISPKLDAHGNEIPPIPKFGTGMISTPEPFECRIVPRSPKTPELIMSRLSAYED